jgi:hypothetical protein
MVEQRGSATFIIDVELDRATHLARSRGVAKPGGANTIAEITDYFFSQDSSVLTPESG